MRNFIQIDLGDVVAPKKSEKVEEMADHPITLTQGPKRRLRMPHRNTKKPKYAFEEDRVSVGRSYTPLYTHNSQATESDASEMYAAVSEAEEPTLPPSIQDEKVRSVHL